MIGKIEVYICWSDCQRRLKELANEGWFCVVGKNKDGCYVLRPEERTGGDLT